jgi:hypothetical protein
MSLDLPSPVYHTPTIDGRQSLTALGVQRGLCRLLRELGHAVITELTLANGRRADVASLAPDGKVWIVEIKSSPTDFHVDSKWPEYRDYCDHFAFAIPPDMDQSIMPENAGLVVADKYGATFLRDAPSHPLPAARRKAVTLLFARIAAQRLHSLWDPAISLVR